MSGVANVWAQVTPLKRLASDHAHRNCNTSASGVRSATGIHSVIGVRRRKAGAADIIACSNVFAGHAAVFSNNYLPFTGS